MATREDMTLQERIDAALKLAERICAECRPKPPVLDLMVALKHSIESGPQSEAQFEEQMRELYPGWGEGE